MKQFIIAIAMFLIYILAVNEYITILKIIGFGSITFVILSCICLVLYYKKARN